MPCKSEAEYCQYVKIVNQIKKTLSNRCIKQQPANNIVSYIILSYKTLALYQESTFFAAGFDTCNE